MKKLTIFLLGLITASCSHNDIQTYTEQEIQEIRYNQSFIDTFGKISPTQSWGFTNVVTRSAETNSNQWGTEEGGGKYKNVLKQSEIPAITEQEFQDVLAVFNQKGEATYTSLVDWSTFFVQQVYKGTASYVAGNGGTVIGGNQMDWLCAYDPNTKSDDHVNNFNNSNGSVMLMMNSSTQRFGYKSSTDNGHVFHYFRMEEINGMYYVGFDFSAEGNNPNEQVNRDYIYNDWIVKIVPGKGYSKVVEEGRIICEDLGTIGDFDFNDVVFDATIYEDGTSRITILAAGGTLDISVAGTNIGEVMGKMVNTGLATVPEYSFTVSGYNSLIDIPIVVSKTDNAGNVTSYQLSAEMGKAPQKICVPKTFKWCKEYKSIKDAYPKFKDWVNNETSFWTGEVNQSLVY